MPKMNVNRLIQNERQYDKMISEMTNDLKDRKDVVWSQDLGFYGHSKVSNNQDSFYKNVMQFPK